MTATYCIVCDSPTTLQCIRCKLVHFCSRDCQRNLWPIHRQYCTNVRTIGTIPEIILPPKYGNIEHAYRNVHPTDRKLYLSEWEFANRIAAHIFSRYTKSTNILKKSTISHAGNGMFASRDYARGEVIDHYPASFVLIMILDQHLRANRSALAYTSIYSHPDHPDSRKLVLKHSAEELREKLYEYSYEMSPIMTPYNLAHLGKYTVIMIASQVESTKFGGAHMCNDGGIYSNASLCPTDARDGANLIAGVHISKGEELLTSYGPLYWQNKKSNGVV